MKNRQIFWSSHCKSNKQKYNRQSHINVLLDLSKYITNEVSFQTDTSIYCFDADFQLVRKSSSGHQWVVPKHQDHFFVEQKLVDDFMNSYHNPKIEKVCFLLLQKKTDIQICNVTVISLFKLFQCKQFHGNNHNHTGGWNLKNAQEVLVPLTYCSVS